ncbi:MAG TPA: hypothetical protein VI997_00650 [Candidatus Thermoplasmatota archaeon]|nr:hypothetical protein [Candidatus Thermoplasmatota archaeon]
MPAKVMQGFLLDVPDTPGALHMITSRLAKAAVNIAGIGGMSFDGHAKIGLVTESTLATREVLREVDANVRPVEYLVVAAKDKPGELDRYLTRLSEAGLNIMCLVPIFGTEPRLAFAVDDPVKGREVLRTI